MNKYWIYGAGYNSKRYIEKLKEFLEIEYILDSAKDKIHTFIDGIEVIEPSMVKTSMYNGQKIINTVTNPAFVGEIHDLLNSFGLKKNVDYIDAYEIVNIFPIPSGIASGVLQKIEGYKWSKGVDNKSRLLKKESEQRIFRVIKPEYCNRYKSILEVCEKNNLFDNYIIKTNVFNGIQELDKYLVLEHEFINPVTYNYEWSPKMIKHSIFFTLDLIKKLTEVGLGLEDGHALNVTIHKGNFVLLDFGALTDTLTGPSVLIEVLNTHIIPFIYVMKGKYDKAYMCMKNADIVFTITDIKGYLNKTELYALNTLYDLAAFSTHKQEVINFIDKTVEFLSNVDLINFDTRWKGYQNDEWNWSENKKLWSTKMHSVIDALIKLKPHTIIDLAGNMGWYGSYLNSQVEYAIVADYDPMCIDYLWEKINDEHMKNVIPVYMSLCNPTLDYYKDYPIAQCGIELWRKNAYVRFKSDVVIALTIIHHLVFAQQLSFEEIICQLSLFSNKYLIIEFVDQTDRYITDFLKDGFEWYTKENFEAQLKQKYRVLDIKGSTPCETRWIYICEKIVK